MKILKGVLTYTLLLLGGAAIVAVALVGCMFLFPSFSVFGWKIMFFSNSVADNAYSTELTGSEYNIVIDAKLHDVHIYQFADETKTVKIEKIDDMFGLYDTRTMETYNSKIDVKTVGNTFTAKLNQIEGAILPRKSRINVHLPKGKSYNITVSTTEGDITIDGAAENTPNLKVTGLDITTVNGNFSWDNVYTSTYKSVYKADDGTAETDTVESIDTTAEGYKKEDYMRFVELATLNATTEFGKFDFTLNYDDAETYIVTAAPIKTSASASTTKRFLTRLPETNWHKNQEFDSNNADTLIGSMRNIVKQAHNGNDYEYFLSATRGEFTFENIIAKGLSVSGSDVLIKGKNIVTLKDFNFNAPNGFFQIDTLNSSLSTIATNNIDINLTQAQGELAITTTYGDIDIKNISKNATLKSEHGNISVERATASLSAVANHGDIYVESFTSKVYLKNNHGRITAIFDKTAFTSKDLPCEIINNKGAINVVDIKLPTTIKSTGGSTINAYFSEMVLGGYAHKIITTGTANIYVPNTQAFLYKGTGTIMGSVGSAPMAANTGFAQILVTDPSNVGQLSSIEVDASSGTAVFAKYDTTKDYAADYKD